MSNKKNSKKQEANSKITTIKLLEETKNRLEKLREHKGESYDSILRKILYVLNVARDEPEKAKRILERISDLRKRRIEEQELQKEEQKKEAARK